MKIYFEILFSLGVPLLYILCILRTISDDVARHPQIIRNFLIGNFCGDIFYDGFGFHVFRDKFNCDYNDFDQFVWNDVLVSTRKYLNETPVMPNNQCKFYFDISVILGGILHLTRFH